MRYCIFWLWIFLPAFAHAQGFYALADSTQNYHLDQEVEILKDEAGRLAFEQILQPDIQKQFKRYGKTSISLGYFYKPVWLKISLQNPLPHTQWLLEIPMPILDTVSFYQQVGKEWKRIQCGYYMPHSTRPVPHTGFAFPLQFSQQKTTLYIQVKGTNPKIIPIRVIEKTRFYEKVRHEDVGYGILFGIFLIMFCYNLMIYITLRDINYLFYLATILCTTSFILTISGYGAKYLWADYPMMNIYGARGAFGFLGISVAIFSISFLEIKRYARLAYYALMSIVPLASLALLLTLSGIMPSATNNVLSLATIIYLTSGIMAWANGNRNARFYVGAWSFYIMGGLMATLRNSGTLPFNFWTTHLVEIGAACETFLIAFALSDRYHHIKKEAQADLEKKVQERTLELKDSNEELLTLNEEIKQQSEEIMAQRDALELAYGRIERQNHDVTDSLEYAKRIQDALLPPRSRIERYFADMLLLYQPKDIVSGDFYWFTTVDSWKHRLAESDGLGLSLADSLPARTKILFLAVVDCTGHGVPGAFMTMIGGGLLDQIINRDKIYSPAQILSELDTRLLRTLQQRDKEGKQVQDGMDISLLQLDLANKQLVWASAKRPLWILEKNNTTFTVYKGDKYPIGGNQFDQKHFTEHDIALKEGDMLYAFSDGYADQFGAKGKFTIRRFKEVLLENRFKPFATQELLLHNHIQHWQGTEIQTDDILVMGLRIG